MNLTGPMMIVLARAVERGGVVAGTGGDGKGSTERNSPSAMRALERRGLVTLHLSPDGGMACRPTDAGRAVAAQWTPPAKIA